MPVVWERYPSVAANARAREWLQIQSDLGLACNTIEAYGRSLERYLRFCELMKDCEKVGHRLTLPSLAVLYLAEGDSRLRHLARLMDEIREAPTSQVTRPPHSDGCVNRRLDIVITENCAGAAHTILNLESKPRAPLRLPTAHPGVIPTRGRAEMGVGQSLLTAPSTDPGVRNYRTGFLPCVMTANVTDGQGCTMWARGM